MGKGYFHCLDEKEKGDKDNMCSDKRRKRIK